MNRVEKLPANFTFPALPHPYIANQSTSGDAAREGELDDGDEMESAVEFTFKSLRQPKFNISLVLDIKPSTKIFHIKTLLGKSLLENPDIGIHVDASDIKLMMRTKTLHDSENILSVLESAGSSDKISLNVLITKFKEKEHAVEPVAVVVDAQNPAVSSDSWLKIREILLHDLKDEAKVEATLKKFQNCV